MPEHCTIYINRSDYRENEIWAGYIDGEDARGDADAR